MTTSAMAAVVQAQLDAYNARDIDAFAAAYSEEVCVYVMPHARLHARGKAQLIERYGAMFRNENRQARVLSRVVMGNKVIDHEEISGAAPLPTQCAAVFEVDQGLISAVWFFPVEGASAPPEAPTP